MDQYFIHDFDLEIGRLLGMPVYWYGAVYTVGFVGTFLWLWFRRSLLGWNRRDVIEFTTFIAVGILLGGRIFDIAVYELDYYRQHPLDAMDWWKGGLASHGVLLGCLIAVASFCLFRKKSFLHLADEVVVPAAFLFAVGRLGNFIEGGVIGTQTSVPWAVVYADLEGARHPVALYESAKNFIIVPILIAVLRRFPAGSGIAFSTFILLYALLRFFVDTLRDYEAYWMGLDRGQFFNLAMAFGGLCLLIWFARKEKPAEQIMVGVAQEEQIGWTYPIALVCLCLYPLGIPTSWTQINIEQKRLEVQQPAISEYE